MTLKAFKNVAGKRKWQKTFEGMYFASLRGMNIGGGDNYATSGEKHVLKIISDNLLYCRVLHLGIIRDFYSP